MTLSHPPPPQSPLISLPLIPFHLSFPCALSTSRVPSPPSPPGPSPPPLPPSCPSSLPPPPLVRDYNNIALPTLFTVNTAASPVCEMLIISEDNVVEPTERFFVNITSMDSDSVRGGGGIVYIRDNDGTLIGRDVLPMIAIVDRARA